MLGYIIYRTVQWIVMTFPRGVTYKLAIFIADIFYIFSRGRRKVLVENLKNVFPEKREEIIGYYARLTFHNFGKYLVDFFRFDKFDRETMAQEVEIDGQDNVEECLRRGRGLITVTAHLGNWELGGVVMSLLGYKFNVVALSHGSVKVDNLFVRQRENKGMNVIPLGRAASACIRAIKRNELVALLGDRDIDGAGVKVPFFGREVSLPRGPAALSAHTGAPILLGFLLRTKSDRFRLILDRPIQDFAQEDVEKKTKMLTEKIARGIEAFIRRYPGQWFMFYPVWE